MEEWQTVKNYNVLISLPLWMACGLEWRMNKAHSEHNLFCLASRAESFLYHGSAMPYFLQVLVLTKISVFELSMVLCYA